MPHLIMHRLTSRQEGTPLQLIGYINSIFSAFDREVKKQGLFKMDTIGDAYVAAGLLNSLDPAEATERCAAMIRLSQRMLKVLEDHREVSGKDLRCRIGISTGEVYAGVLGRLQPRYHLFGEPMRTAEQLEQRCAVDGVHVSAPVMEALSSRPGLQVCPMPYLLISETLHLDVVACSRASN
ncbi:nucleotide cyclase [Baffinella frigidus]|nr:nucleotide cyclase [Cryptophyta sp. CCMP2293]